MAARHAIGQYVGAERDSRSACGLFYVNMTPGEVTCKNCLRVLKPVAEAAEVLKACRHD